MQTMKKMNIIEKKHYQLKIQNIQNIIKTNYIDIKVK